VRSFGRTTALKSAGGNSRTWAKRVQSAATQKSFPGSTFVICRRVTSISTNGYRYTYASTPIARAVCSFNRLNGCRVIRCGFMIASASSGTNLVRTWGAEAEATVGEGSKLRVNP